MGMFNFKARHNDFAFDAKSQQNMHIKRQSKVVSQPVHLPTPPMSPKQHATHITPSSSVESTPKTSIDLDSPALTVSRINFAEETLPEYADSYAVLIDNALTRSECKQLIHDAERSTSQGWERAMVNIGAGQQAMYTDQRNCGRIIWDSQEVIDNIWERVSHLPEIQEIMTLQNQANVTGNGPARRNETWNFERPNERMRFLKYEDGEYFRPHCDGSYETPDRKQRSYYTMHLYLNDAGPPSSQQLRSLSKEEARQAKKNALQGGNTSFHSYDGHRKFDVVPKAGSILIFQHRNLLHSGTDVLHGTKYTMRTDLMYSKA